MQDQILIHLRDIAQAMANAWTREFEGIDTVTVSCGDIFTDVEGPVDAGKPIDIKADAIISPANSFGFMDGGIDAVYTYQFGEGLQRRLQETISNNHGGEIPIGQAVIVPTENPDIPWCISAPTMRVPQDVSDTVNAYLAFRAALQAVIAHNETSESPIRTLLCPGLGTAVGRMPVERCARQMRAAWNRVLGEGQVFPAHLGRATDDHRWLMQ